MAIPFSAFALGVAGFFGFEALRVYKHCLPTGKKPYPKADRNVILLTMITVGGFSGVVAALWSPDDLAKALYIGFTIPTASKYIFAQPSGRTPPISIDEIEMIQPGSVDVAVRKALETKRKSPSGVWEKVKAGFAAYFD